MESENKQNIIKYITKLLDIKSLVRTNDIEGEILYDMDYSII